MQQGPSLQIRLTWDDPSTGAREERVVSLPAILGREQSNSIPLNSGQVSRQHARLEQDGSQVVLVDLNSSNGTFVNQQRITRQPLADGASFQIGPFSFNIDLSSFAQTAPSSSTQAVPNPFGQTPPPPAGAWLLRWVDPTSNQPREVPLNQLVTLGRDANSTIVLVGGQDSRNHARIESAGNQLVLTDGSSNGTYLNNVRLQRSQPAPIKAGDQIRIGNLTFTVASAQRQAGGAATMVESRGGAGTMVETFGQIPPTPPPPSAHPSLVFDVSGLQPFASSAPAPASSHFPPPIFQQPIVSMAALRQTRFPVEETTYLAVGGGIGSFVWANHLRIFGVPASQITSIGLNNKAYGRYEELCRNSQIPLHERLRSNSDSCPDNIWGWPGYAVREMWGDLKSFNLGPFFQIGWQIFAEPTFSQTYTPRAGNVFASIDKEAVRIDWHQIWHYGRAKAIRKTDDGRYVVAYSRHPSESPNLRHSFLVAPYVHVAIGYPGVRFLKDLQEYRERTRDDKRVVNAYEDHEHVYNHLAQRGGLVMVRGRGIVSSRIIQKIYEMRQRNANIAVLHLMRTPVSEGARYRKSQRIVDNHWEFQPFNWPKAAWSGDLRNVLEDASPSERDRLLTDWGGTTTADRQDWRDMVTEGISEGWYQIRFGDVSRVEMQNNRLVTMIRGRGNIQDESRLEADFIIDGTGLESGLEIHPLLKDMVDHHQLGRNPKGRLVVENDFEITGMRNHNGRIYASGVMTLGGPYAPVDSFLGLQYAALRSVDALAQLKTPNLRRLNGFRSFFQWLRWATGAKP